MGTLGEYIKKHLEVNAFVIWHHLNKTELNQASYITFVIPNIYTPGHVLGEGLGVSPKQMWSGGLRLADNLLYQLSGRCISVQHLGFTDIFILPYILNEL